ncbi:MAG: IS200/IS605 family transposase [Chloroflexota bacterium]
MKKYAAHTELYIHIVWGTWDRLPLVNAAIEPRLYAAIAAKCRELTCIPLAIGGITDHVHLLVRLHAPISVSELVKGVKGSSSHLVTHEIAPGQFFKWQGSYSAFSVGREALPRLEAYIANRKRHHIASDLLPDWELSNAEAKE